MRHGNSKTKLSRFTAWRKATLLSLAKNLLIYESIRTTSRRAKAVRPLVEKLVSLAKQGTIAARRRAFSILGDHKLVSLLFKEIGPRFKAASGFTRAIGIGKRRGDDAKLVIFELTEKKPKQVKKSKKAQEARPDKEQAALEQKPEVKAEEKAQAHEAAPAKERAPHEKKPTKKFLGGLRNIFKKERDSL